MAATKGGMVGMVGMVGMAGLAGLAGLGVRLMAVKSST